MAKTKKKSLVAQSNKLNEARSDWSVLMSRSYVRIMDIFSQRYDAFKSSNPNEIDLFGVSNYAAMLVYDIARSSMAVIGKDGKPNIPTVEEFKTAFDKLLDNKVVTGRHDDPKSWKKINILGGAEYDEQSDTIHCDMSPMMLEHLCGLKKRFTEFNPFIVMMFNESKYTFRFYEFCCQWKKKGSFDLTIEQIKWRFKLNQYNANNEIVKEKYKSIRDLKKYVIDPARDELRKLYDDGNCDICFEYENQLDKTKPGRPTTTGFHFNIIKKQESKELPKPKPLQLNLFAPGKDGKTPNEKLLTIRNKLMYWHRESSDKNWPTRATNELGKAAQTRPNLIDDVFDFICEVEARLNNWDSRKRIKSPAAYTKKAWKVRFNIDVPPMSK